MNKKAVGKGAIILIVILLVLIAIFIVVLGIAIFNGDKTTSGSQTTGTQTPGTETGTETNPGEIPTPQPETKNDNSKKAPAEKEQTQQVQYIDNRSGDKVNPNYGRCTSNWPDNAGASQPGVSESVKSQCTKHIEESNCKAVDIYSSITDTFGLADGIPDCNWN